MSLADALMFCGLLACHLRATLFSAFSFAFAFFALYLSVSWFWYINTRAYIPIEVKRTLVVGR